MLLIQVIQRDKSETSREYETRVNNNKERKETERKKQPTKKINNL